jgi:hypothetical protein
MPKVPNRPQRPRREPPQPQRPPQERPTPNREIRKDVPLPDAIEPDKPWPR